MTKEDILKYAAIYRDINIEINTIIQELALLHDIKEVDDDIIDFKITGIDDKTIDYDLYDSYGDYIDSCSFPTEYLWIDWKPVELNRIAEKKRAEEELKVSTKKEREELIANLDKIKSFANELGIVGRHVWV